MITQSAKQTALIRGALRNVARYMPQKKEAMMRALDPFVTGIRGGAMYTCAKCGKAFKGGDIQVDHIEPVVPIGRELKDWNEYIDRLFCDVSNLQVLCKPCHLEKSNDENSRRA